MTASSPERRIAGAAAQSRTATPSSRIFGNAVFFPLATAHGIVVAPASVLSMLGLVPTIPGLATPSAHARELLFGFALAVVAGNQLGPRRRAVVMPLAALWLLARASWLWWPASPVALVSGAAFPLLLALALAPRLLASAKKWRNQTLPVTLIAICGGAALFAVLSVGPAADRLAHIAPERLLAVAVALFATLLLFMGGRYIAPAVAGQFYRQGQNLAARVQPRIESVLIVLAAVAVSALALDGARPDRAVRIAAGGALILAGVLAAVRTVRWRLWALRGRPDLLCLAAGYAWLALGLAAFGAALALDAPQAERTRAIHVITVGSLGTLTLNVMAMTRLPHARRPAWLRRLPVLATLLLAAATLLRVFAEAIPDTRAALIAAALCWSLAFALLLALLMSAARGDR